LLRKKSFRIFIVNSDNSRVAVLYNYNVMLGLNCYSDAVRVHELLEVNLRMMRSGRSSVSECRLGSVLLSVALVLIRKLLLQVPSGC
jgi:hypothetical protein